MADPVSIKDYNQWSKSYRVSKDDGDGVPSKDDVFVDRSSGSEVAFENVQSDICSYYSERGHQLSDIEQCRPQSGNTRTEHIDSADQVQGVDIFGQFQTGLVRFIGSEGSPTVWMKQTDGTIEIEYFSSTTTAAALIGQLRSFGLKDIDQGSIQQIAGRNDNTTFEGAEVEELDQYLEQATSRDKTIVMQAVSINGNALQYADAALKKDRQVVMAALQSNRGPAFCFADESLKKD